MAEAEKRLKQRLNMQKEYLIELGDAVPVSNDADAMLSRISDDADQAGLPARRRHYDAMLPSLNLTSRSWLRLTFDLMVGVLFLLALWGLDEVRVRLERIASVTCRPAAANRHEECQKKQEARQQSEG